MQVTLWDTGGLERYESMTSNYYRNCNAVILTYDLTVADTLFCLETWQQEALKCCRWPQKVVFSLWGNKCDVNEEATADEVISAFAESQGLDSELCFKVSARTGHMVEEAMGKVVAAVHARFSKGAEFLEWSVDPDRDVARLTPSAEPRSRTWCPNFCRS